MKQVEFCIWLGVFVEEKGVDLSDYFICADGAHTQLGNVVQAMMAAPVSEQQKMFRTLVRLDFLNADVLDYFAFLAKAQPAAEFERIAREAWGA